MDEGPRNWGTPLYERTLHRAGVGRGTSLLDLGCGAGLLCRIAADRGARVTGIDRDARQIEHAAALVPEGAFEVGDILALPYPAAKFDVVICVQSIMHVTNPLTVLREAARVARPGAPVVITVWGKEENCDIRAFGRALSGLLPRPGGRDEDMQPPSLLADGRLERLATLAGLAVREVGEVVCPFQYPDEDTLLRTSSARASGDERCVSRTPPPCAGPCWRGWSATGHQAAATGWTTRFATSSGDHPT